MRFVTRLSLGFAIGCFAQAAMLRAAEPPQAGVEDGAWRVNALGGDAARPVCLANRAQMLRIGMPSTPCTRRLVASTQSEWTVEYFCAAVGTGRSTFRRLDGETVRIATQGIVRGRPFAADYEAKRLTRCP